jgi:hypothetical protein
MEKRGYLLPDGDAFTDDMLCCMVYVPNKVEYRRAFFGALDYFGTWIAWERDEGKRGKDAARAWMIANALTRECWEMGCDDMLSTLQDIRNILLQQKCCGGDTYVTYNQNTVVTTTISPDVGDYPTTWGEDTEIESWDEWKQYVCYHAQAFVDTLIEIAGNFNAVTSVAGWYIEFIGWAFTKLTYLWPVFVPVQWNVQYLQSIVDGIIFVWPDIDFEDLADRFEAAREDIVCAIMLDGDIESEVQAAVDSTVLWNLIFQWVDYQSMKSAIYSGEVEGIGYLPPGTSEACECVEESEYTALFPFLTTIEGWVNQYSSQWNWNPSAGYSGGTGGGVRVNYSVSDYFGLGSYWLGVKAGVSPSIVADDSVFVKKFSLWYRSTAASPNGTSLKVQVLQGNGSAVQFEVTLPRTYNVWTYYEHEIASPVAINGNAFAIKLFSVSGNALYLDVDEFYIEFDLERA